MKKLFGITAILLLVVFLAGLGIYVLLPQEPSYRGWPLSSWLRQLDDGDMQEGIAWTAWDPKRTAKQKKAAEAIRQMGTNTLPYLLRSMTNRDSGLRIRVMGLLAKQHIFKVPKPLPGRQHRTAALAFDALGPIAKDAVPDLARILTNPPPSGVGYEREAAIALAAIEPEGRQALIAASGSSNWSGLCAIWGLVSHHVIVPPEVMETLERNVKTTGGGNGAMSAWALGELKQDPENVLPVLIAGLKSTNVGTRWGSALGLGLWGTNAISAIPALKEALNDSDLTTVNYAKESLKKIAPEGRDKAAKD